LNDTNVNGREREHSQVFHVFFALRVREVRSLIGVQSKTQLAFIRPEVVAHKIRVLVEINGLQCQLPQALSPVLCGGVGGGVAWHVKNRRWRCGFAETDTHGHKHTYIQTGSQT
jgi:hypothetical protein